MSNNSYIQVEDVLNMGAIRGFKPFIDSRSGTIEWSNGRFSGQYLYATPNWKEEGKVPISLYTGDGNYYELALLTLTDTSKEAQLTQYRSCLEGVISEFIY